MELTKILMIVVCHYLGDWVFQSEKMGKEKSTNSLIMAFHCLLYGYFMMVLGIMILNNNDNTIYWNLVFIFTILNTGLHCLVDCVTAGLTSYFHKNNNMYAFWKIIGLDQTIHYFCLFITTYYFLNSI